MKKIMMIVMMAIMLTGLTTAIDVSSCQTLDSNGAVYDLTQDLTITGDCFIVNTTGFTFDCNGHSLTGGNSFVEYSTQYVKYDGEHSGITIRNCESIGQGNFFLASYDNYTDVTIENLVITNFVGIAKFLQFNHIDDLIVSNITMTNSDDFLSFDSTGFSSSYLLVEDSTFIDVNVPFTIYGTGSGNDNILFSNLNVAITDGGWNEFDSIADMQMINVVFSGTSDAPFYAYGCSNMYFENVSMALEDLSPSNPPFYMDTGATISTNSKSNIGWFPKPNVVSGDIDVLSANAYYEGCDATNVSLQFYYNNNGNTNCNSAPVINSITPNSRVELIKSGDSQVYSASVTDTEDDATYSWKLDDVEVSTGTTYTAAWNDLLAGVYTLELNVSDGTYSDTASVTLEIRAVGGSASGGSGSTLVQEQVQETVQQVTTTATKTTKGVFTDLGAFFKNLWVKIQFWK